ncbi:MAG TPA: peptidase S41, partial [Chloroflexota bacterium]|nr:peptidase S41 [Chloroflexota bacterium]
YQLANGSTMRLTDRLWLTPKKRSVNHVGLTPDIAVSPAATAPGGLDDPDVLAAEKYLLSHPGP